MHYISFFVLVSFVGEAILGIANLTVEKTVFVEFQNKCIEDLGCFYTGPPFYDPVDRPISLPPIDGIETKFFLYTPSNPDKGDLLKMTAESVINSAFVNELSTKVLIHAYIQKQVFAFSLHRVKDELLKVGPYNVIMVDWSEYNGLPYPQAVANGRVVGAQLAKLIKLLIEHRQVTAESFHLIGHSLGGQITGWTGERIPNLGRITGLDPAGPYFQNAENKVRLDGTDAIFVDVIHTNGGNKSTEGLGTVEPIGDIDFYPNGGTKQPGCLFLNNKTRENDDSNEFTVNVCSHLRVVPLFLDSIQTCSFLAVQCEDYESFERGECGGNNMVTNEMGYKAQKTPGLMGPQKFYLNTNAKSPFCIE